MPAYRVYTGTYVVGGAWLTHPLDSNIYLVRREDSAVLIDAGTGEGWERVVGNLLEMGVDPRIISRIIITHCHVSNAGGAEKLRRVTGGMVVAHEPDAGIMRRGDPDATLASEHGLSFQPVVVGFAIKKHIVSETLGKIRIRYIHTPGHTPGSMSIHVSMNGARILFIGDLFGPLSRRWGSSEAEWRRSMEEIHGLEYDVMCSSTRCTGLGEGRRFVEEALKSGPVWV